MEKNLDELRVFDGTTVEVTDTFLSTSSEISLNLDETCLSLDGSTIRRGGRPEV